LKLNANDPIAKQLTIIKANWATLAPLCDQGIFDFVILEPFYHVKESQNLAGSTIKNSWGSVDLLIGPLVGEI
jgi:hypothetical protein